MPRYWCFLPCVMFSGGFQIHDLNRSKTCVATFSSSCDTLISSTYQSTVHCLLLIILLAKHHRGQLQIPISAIFPRVFASKVSLHGKCHTGLCTDSHAVIFLILHVYEVVICFGFNFAKNQQSFLQVSYLHCISACIDAPGISAVSTSNCSSALIVHDNFNISMAFIGDCVSFLLRYLC